MISFILKKLFFLICSLFLIASLTFLLMKVSPGNPFQDEKGVVQSLVDQMVKNEGFEESLWVQYKAYMQRMCRGDFGRSLCYRNKEVWAIIRDSFPTSLILGSKAIVLALVLGISLGTLAAYHKGTKIDTSILVVMTIFHALPTFILAALLQYYLGFRLHLFPAARLTAPLSSVLPVLSLAAFSTATITRLFRKEVVAIEESGFMLSMRARGFSQRHIFFKHTLKNALIPLLHYLGHATANVLIGSSIIERIFAIPGLGFWFITAILTRDYPLIAATSMVYGVTLLFAGFMTDFLAFLLDPRLRVRERKV